MKTILTKQDVLELMAASQEAAERRHADFEASLQKSNADFNKQMKELNKKMGELTDTIGEAAEAQVRENVIALFRERKIILDEIFPNAIKENFDGTILYEIDLLVVNTMYAVAVEVKNTLRQRDVENHLKQIEKIEQHPMSCVKGKILIGAVAGMLMKHEVAEFAMKKGLFVIKPKGDAVKILNKHDFKFQEWNIRK